MLKDLLKECFKDTGMAELAMYQDLKGWADILRDPDGKALKDSTGMWVYGDYKNSPFEDWAAEHGVGWDVVDHYGGEDEGTRYDTTYKFTKGDEELYMQFYGYYQSYDGATYEDYRFVTPREKTIIEYV